VSIRVLDPATAGQIAAGEVVERPASAVKELVDNAIDAGARRVDVEVGEGTLTVSDDGEGMDRAEVPLALQRHATSKIRTIADLGRLRTLGFRGEALPAIAAVSRLRIVTRRREGAVATEAVCEGGGPPELRDCAAPPGTTVEVADLFFNTPARRAALRSPQAEAAAVAEVVRAAAFSHPEVAFTLRLHGREALRTAGGGRLEDVALAVWGAGTAQALLPVHGREGGIELYGMTGKPEAARGGRGDQYLAVNGRPVRSEAVRGAVEAAYRGLLEVHRFPLFALHLVLDPAAVDVNVHPRKAEVRFADVEAVRRLCFRTVKAALAGAVLVPEAPVAATALRESAAAPWAAADAPARRDWSPLYQPLPEAVLPRLVPIGQLAAAYILAEGPDGLYIVDQHAAHERVFFERFERAVARQLLLQPAAVELGDPPVAELAAAGFTLEPFGPGTWLLRAVPADLSGREPLALLRDFVAHLAEEPVAEPPQRRAARALAACKAAVKAGDPLTAGEMAALLEDLASCRQAYTCPHGRPTVLRLTYPELERRFGRG
jgi:DNA mismatch repair protein MutL